MADRSSTRYAPHEFRAATAISDAVTAPGGTIITSNTTPVSNVNVYQLVVLSATARFTAITAADVIGATGIDLPTGTILVSSIGITSYTLTNGVVAAYTT